MKKCSHSISMKSFESPPKLVKANCKKECEIGRATRKRFLYDHYPIEAKSFEYNQQFQTK